MKIPIAILFILFGIAASAQKTATGKPRKEPDTSIVYAKAEIEPKFMCSFREFMEKNLRLLPDSACDPYNVNVTFEFIVGIDGKVSNIRLAKDSDPGSQCYVEACKEMVRKSTGCWSAGIINGVPVKSWHRQKISFHLVEEE